MPKFDYTVNVPLLVTLIIAAFGIAARFVRLETIVEKLVQQFDTHERKDDLRFQEEREERHELRGHIDGRLRGVENGLSELKGQAAGKGIR